METPRAKFKFDEAGFSLENLHRERERDAHAFGYFLSAFLNAAYSFVQVQEVEAKRGLKEHAANKKQAKAAFRPWYANWVETLPAADRQVGS